MVFRSFRSFNLPRQITPTYKQPNIRFFCNSKKSSFFQAVVHLYRQFSKEIKLVIGASSIAGSAFFLISNYSSFKTIGEDAYSAKMKLLPDVVAKSELRNSKAGDGYVHRPELEILVNKALTFTPREVYYIVYGNKGVGKSEIFTHAAIGKKGVIHIDVTSVHSKDDIVQELLKELQFKDSLNINGLVEEMRKVKDKYDIYPTILFDVELAGVEHKELGTEAVRSLSKALAGTCRCIIILSEANAVLQFGRDSAREEFIFVDELTESEAIEFLKNEKLALTPEEMKYVFKNIGTNPAFLVKLIEKVSNQMSIQRFVDSVLADAREDLKAFPLQTILKALKDHPDGVDPEYFNNQEEEGVDLTNHKAVGRVMKENPNPIIYRQDLKRYQLSSTAHHTALKSYEPPV